MSAARETAPDRGAHTRASRSTPLTIVSGAVAGDDLQSAAWAAALALGRIVAIVLPRLGEPVLSSSSVNAGPVMGRLRDHAIAAIAGAAQSPPAGVAAAVPVTLAGEVVGLVAALGEDRLPPEHAVWLEAAATAAAITLLLQSGAAGDTAQSCRMLLQALSAGVPSDAAEVLNWARRLGSELGSGAVAIAARSPAGVEPPDLPSPDGALLAEVGDGLALGLLPLTPGGEEAAVASVVRDLSARGMTVARSSPRRDAGALHDALREAELLLELSRQPASCLAGQEETYRLLIGVLLRNPGELEELRQSTIVPLEAYDSEHDTELVATLVQFLAHHGSTTDTAEVMALHRHTVGYRLTRVGELSGLSPYETEGRERLSLGLKAHHILNASHRREQRE